MLLTPYAACTTLSVGSVLAALTSAFDLAVHPVNLSEHVFRPGLHLQIGSLAVRVVLNAQLLLDGIEHLQHTGDFMLRQQPHVHIQRRPTVCLIPETVLTDEHKG